MSSDYSVKEENSSSSEGLNFSVDHILNKAGEQYEKMKKTDGIQGGFYTENQMNSFSWLQCTRYCPPKLPRFSKREVSPQKRKLDRHPRIPFSSTQIHKLEEKYKSTPYLTGQEVVELAKELELADIRVKVWFQNRRARDRRESKNKTIVSEELGKTKVQQNFKT